MMPYFEIKYRQSLQLLLRQQSSQIEWNTQLVLFH